MVIASGCIIQMKNGGARNVIDLHPQCIKAGRQQCWCELTVLAGKTSRSGKNIGADCKPAPVHTAPRSRTTPDGLNLAKPPISEACHQMIIAVAHCEIADHTVPGRDPLGYMLKSFRIAQAMPFDEDEPRRCCLRSAGIPHGGVVSLWHLN